MSGTLSIIVTIVGGGAHLEAFLDALERFRDPPDLDVIIPFDASVGLGETLKCAHPRFRFLDLGTIETERPITSEAGRHELYDRRRAAGLAAARGEVIAILEDFGLPASDWAAAAMRLHASRPEAVIGGVIECDRDATLLNWAVWVTDLGRYGGPVEQEEVAWVSDVNITYKRAAIEATRPLWARRYHEPVIHWHLMEQGQKLILSDELVVTHKRAVARLGPLLRERFDWGRLFGYMRGRSQLPGRRLAGVIAAPLVPPILWFRHGRVQARRGRLGKYIRALPLVMILTTTWTLGETWGTLTRRT